MIEGIFEADVPAAFRAKAVWTIDLGAEDTPLGPVVGVAVTNRHVTSNPYHHRDPDRGGIVRAKAELVHRLNK